MYSRDSVRGSREREAEGSATIAEMVGVTEGVVLSTLILQYSIRGREEASRCRDRERVSPRETEKEMVREGKGLRRRENR
jgi:hypothetical protein